MLFLQHDRDQNLELSHKEYQKFLRLIERTIVERETGKVRGRKGRKSSDEEEEAL